MKHPISTGGRDGNGQFSKDHEGGRNTAVRSTRPLRLTLMLLVLALLLLGGCAGRDIAELPPAPAPSVPPGLQHSGTQHQFYSFESAGLTFHFTITNPGPDTLQLRSYRYHLEEEGRPPGPELNTDAHTNDHADIDFDSDPPLAPDRSLPASGHKDLVDRRVPGGGSASLEVPIQLPLGEPIKGQQPRASQSSSSESLESSPGDKSAKLRYRLVVEVSAENETDENIQLTSKVLGTLPRPQLPELRVPEVVITQFKTHTIDIEYKLEISNPNAFPLVLSQAEYTFAVGGTVWDKGPLPQGLQIPPESSRSVNKPMVFNYLQAGRKTVDTLISGRSTDYRLTGTAAALPAESKSSDSTVETDLTEPVPYSFSFELEETAALIRP